MSDAILVLGMHRAGTSAVAGVLSKIGGSLPKTQLPADEGNASGYFESKALMDFHDQLLQSGGSYWHDWRAFNPAWTASSVAVTFKKRAKELFAEEYGGQPLAIVKDPRVCRFPLFWFDIFEDIGVAAHTVIPIRSPLEVAQSLKRRHGIFLPKGLLLWLRHTLDAELATRNRPRSIFTWPDFQTDWRRIAKRIESETGLIWPAISDRSSREIEGFLDDKAVHFNIADGELSVHSDVQEWTLTAYEALVNIAKNSSCLANYEILDAVRTKFNTACDVFGPLMAEYEINFDNELKSTSAAREDNERIKAALETSDSKNSCLQLKIDELDDTLSQKDGEIRALKQAQDAAREQVSELRGALIQANQYTVELTIQKDSEIQTLREAKDATQREFAELTEALALAIQNDVATTAQKESEIYAIQNAHEATRRQLRELNGAIEQANVHVAAMPSQKDGDIQDPEQSHQVTLEQVAKLKAALDHSHAIAAEAAQKDAEIANLMTILINTQGSLHAFAQQIGEQPLGLDQGRAELNKLPDTAKTILDAAMKSWQTKTARLANRIDKMASEHDNTLARAKSASTTTEALLAHLDPANRKVFAFGIAMPRFVLVWLMTNKLSRVGLFDKSWYRKQYAFIAKSREARHYFNFGFASYYKPNPLFDNLWYLDRYEDVRRSGVNPLWHYANSGWREGRDPGPRFSTNFYLNTYPDVAATQTNPLAHYLRHGRHEGRIARPI